MPVYGTSYLVRDFGADFWYVCYGHNRFYHYGISKLVTC